MKKNFPCDLQLDKMDCGPACLKMIAKYYGKYYSLQYLRVKCGITREGVSFLDISYAAENIGLKSLALKCSIDELMLKVPLPVIIHWDNSHFIIIYDINTRRGVLHVSDPAKGHITYKQQDFIKKWYKEEEGRGMLLAIEPQAEFYQRQAGAKKLIIGKGWSIS